MIDIDRTTFKAEVRQAGEALSPLRAGLLFAREIAYPDLRASESIAQLDYLAETARRALTAYKSPVTRSLALSEWLFKTHGFQGNDPDYYDPRNSYLNEVLERHIGIPISLSVIYLALGEQLGLPVLGVGLPGHFIVAVVGEDGPVYLDPFNAGRVLAVNECANIALRATNADEFDPDWLRPAAPRDIVGRMLNNLRGFYLRVEDWPLSIAVVEHLRDLQPDVSGHLRDLGLLHYRNGALRTAAHYFTHYLARHPDAEDADSVRHSREALVEHLAKLN